MLTDYFDGAINFELNDNHLLDFPHLSPVIHKEGEEDVKPKIPLHFCPICANEAGKHSHYGGRGCSSCRAFFRRSVQNRSHERFACKVAQNCMIDSKSWKSCKFCRFQKCLQSGMKPSLVLNEDERKIRHQKRTGGNADWLLNLRRSNSESSGK